MEARRQKGVRSQNPHFDVSQLRLDRNFCDAGASISIAQPGEQPIRRQRKAARGGQISQTPWLLSLRNLQRTLLI